SFERSGRGGCFKLPLIDLARFLIIGGLNNHPVCADKGTGLFSLWRSHPSFAKEGSSRVPNIIWTAWLADGKCRIAMGRDTTLIPIAESAHLESFARWTRCILLFDGTSVTKSPLRCSCR